MNKAKQAVLVMLCLFLTTIPPGCSHESTPGQAVNLQNTMGSPVGGTADNSLIAEVSKANGAGKYAFVLFYRDENNSLAQLREVVEGIKGKLEPKAYFMEAKVDSAAAQPYVTKYNLDRSPMPLLLSFATNGIAVRALQSGCSAQDVENAFVSPKTAESFKAVQEGKTLLLLFGNDATAGFEDTLTAVRRVALVWKNTTAITVDPADAEEKSFLEQSGIHEKIDKAVLLVIRGGSITARLEGSVSDQQITDALNASARQGPSC
jgi:hypothetical protein